MQINQSFTLNARLKTLYPIPFQTVFREPVELFARRFAERSKPSLMSETSTQSGSVPQEPRSKLNNYRNGKGTYLIKGVINSGPSHTGGNSEEKSAKEQRRIIKAFVGRDLDFDAFQRLLCIRVEFLL